MHRRLTAVIAAAVAAPVPAQFVEPTTLIHNWPGESANDQFGFINRNLGDLDLDGINDIGVGVPARDEAGTDAGKAYVYSGATGVLIRSHLGPTPGIGFGYEMGGVGDLNAYGYPDFAISSLTNGGRSNPQRGRVYVIAGDPEPLCAADCDANAILNADDLDCYVAAFLATNLIDADCDTNGLLNLDDIGCFVETYLSGCG